MEHTQATSTHAAERYLLGELNDSEAEAFEEHFFDCVLCADDVRDEARMIDAGRALARSSNVVSMAARKRAGWGWLQVAAAAILVIGIGFSMMIAQRAQPLVAVGRQATLEAVRDKQQGPQVITLRKGELASLYIDVDAGDYRWQLNDSAGKSVGSGTADKDTTRAGLNLLLGNLSAGNYTLVIDGVREDGSRLASMQQFSIRR